MQPESSFLCCEYRKENVRGLYSKKKFKKGQIVCTEVPTAVLHKNNACNLISCSNCRKVLDMSDIQTFHKCNLTSKCDALFCSEVCFSFALKGSEASKSVDGWHNFTCVEVLGSLRTEQYFVEQDACQLATIILAKSISQVSAAQTEIDREVTILSSLYSPEKLRNSVSEQFESEDEIDLLMSYQNDLETLQTHASEFLPLLKECWLSKLGEFSIAIKKLLKQELFLKLVTGIHVSSRAIEVDLSDNVDVIQALDSRSTTSESIKLSFKDGYSRRGSMKEAKGSFHMEKSRRLLNTSLFCSPLLSALNHSCCPNVQLETSSRSRLGLQVKFVAIQNIRPNDILTVSYIPTQLNIHLRRKNLLQSYGFTCRCCKCSWECGSFEFSLEEIVSMSHVAFDECRFKDSLTLVKFGCKRWGREGELFHTMGMIQLALGKWSKAHDTWHVEHFETGVSLFLKKQKMKDKAYITDLSKSHSNVRNNRLPSASRNYITLAAGAIWLLPSLNLSKNTCKRWIALAEKFASSQGGWCTNRHVSVATTDIPIHHIPDLVNEWNSFVLSDLIPLAEQLLIASMFNKRLCVHDAFIVKYDASKGRSHLPIHRDQSEVSVTLALNSDTEFGGGGGTMFPNLGITICPKIGEVLLFRGDLEHSGFPIYNGLRYIIAAFFFLEKKNKNA